MNLSEALDRAARFFAKYTSLPNEHAAVMLALWAAHTHVSPAFYTTPRLVITSPVAGSGKTRVLELLQLLVHEPRMTVSSTPAALFRRVGKAYEDNLVPPTILFDEIDAVFGPRPGEQTEQLRALMNAGYKRGATVDRCEGDASQMAVREWPVFAPLALAGLAGRLPDTISSRAVIVEMRKRAQGEKVAPFRERVATEEIKDVRAFFGTWAKDSTRQLSRHEPHLPPGVEDRPAEVWEPLLSIAELAKGDWPERAREACKYFVFAPSSRPLEPSVQLLSDIREVMGHSGDSDFAPVDFIKSDELISRLHQLEESPWSTWKHGSGLTPHSLADLLRGYNVRTDVARVNGSVVRCYMLRATNKQDGLADAWSRYLPPPTLKPVTGVTHVTTQVNGDKSVTIPEGVTHSTRNNAPPQLQNESVTETRSVTEKYPSTSTVTQVTGVTGFGGGVGPSREQLVINTIAESEEIGLGSIMRKVRESERNAAWVPDTVDALLAQGRVTEHNRKFALARS